ncbi:MAG: hypothetical protein RMJ19_04595 [Gemmatales bacterium]|nr:hypothetical protein [Gemmatales bacterium]MCS7159730.1 hypothetical protein [Gemmatales bacterium]MDW8174928.1 hypothetical protein [Gemmatales bacterium]MDW8221878.1 hypothetical protein [Gemmatales bacterium]
MSRLIHSWKRDCPSSSPTGQLSDSEPKLLLSSEYSAEQPTDAVEIRADEAPIPFVEIPEPYDSRAEASAHQLAAEPGTQLRFQASQDAGSLDGEIYDSPVCSLVERAKAWQPEVQIFWEHVTRAQARQILLACALPETSAAEPILKLTYCLTQYANPLLLVEVSASLGLHRSLGRAPTPGFTDWLAGLPGDCTIQTTALNHVHYLAPGHDLAATHRRFFGRAWEDFLSHLRARYSLTLFLAPPTSSWAFALALVVDAVAFLSSSLEAHGAHDSRFLALQACASKTLGHLQVRQQVTRAN